MGLAVGTGGGGWLSTTGASGATDWGTALVADTSGATDWGTAPAAGTGGASGVMVTGLPAASSASS